MTADVLEIKHIPTGGNENGSLKAREGELRAVLAPHRLCALLSDALGGFSLEGEMEILLRGKTVFPRSPRAALKKGVSVISSESVFAPGLSLSDHIRLLPGMLCGRKKARAKAEALCAEYGWTLDLTTPAGALSAGGRYRGEILLALLRGSEVLALREPEAALTPLEAEQTAAGLRKACQRGKTVLLLTARKWIAGLADGLDALSPAADDKPPNGWTLCPAAWCWRRGV